MTESYQVGDHERAITVEETILVSAKSSKPDNNILHFIFGVAVSLAKSSVKKKVEALYVALQ